ncbi:hypothetical protein MLPF_2218 [Mycobacterium lepromatosis]|nr:hypothetical protein MLPF_2218 [Mycobacterium lepromatosis]
MTTTVHLVQNLAVVRIRFPGFRPQTGGTLTSRRYTARIVSGGYG